MKVVSVTEFKAKCLALLDEVETSGESITVTRRGRPCAVVGPAKNKKVKSLRNMLAGRAEIVGDIVDTSYMWKDFAKGEDL